MAWIEPVVGTANDLPNAAHNDQCDMMVPGFGLAVAGKRSEFTTSSLAGIE
jgi:hypothetical protein